MKKMMLGLAGVAVFALGLAALVGCDTDGSPTSSGLDDYFTTHPYVSDPRASPESTAATSNIVINPVTATVTYEGQEIVFTASQGYGPYTWDVADPSAGRVASMAWSQGIYTALKVAPNNVIVADASGHAAIANIVVSVSGLAVSANPSTLTTDGNRSVVTASGGVPPYRWRVSNKAYGSISSSTGSSIVYTRLATGDNGVTCTDDAGNVGSVVISQPSSGPTTLSLTVAPQTLNANGAKSVLSVAGGTAPYVWTLNDVALGSLSANSGSSVIYTRLNAGDNAVNVTDSSSPTKTANTVIYQP